jgi:RNA polymerase sigma-70 factor (ECF subfamily)
MELTVVIDEVRKGNKEEFRHIIRLCNQPLFRTALVMLKNETDAEDAVQSAYLKAYLYLPSFRGESSFVTWITRILINECKMVLRRKHATLPMELEEVKQKQSNGENDMGNVDKKQIHQWLEKAVMDLPDKYRLVYVVREVNEFSTEKAAEILELSEENVKVRLHRAKALIRENLLKHASATELFPFGNQRCDRLADKVMLTIRNMQCEN